MILPFLITQSAAAVEKPVPKKEEKPEDDDDDDDDDFELFGDDDEQDDEEADAAAEKVKQARIEAYNAKKSKSELQLHLQDSLNEITVPQKIL